MPRAAPSQTWSAVRQPLYLSRVVVNCVQLWVLASNTGERGQDFSRVKINGNELDLGTWDLVIVRRIASPLYKQQMGTEKLAYYVCYVVVRVRSAK